MKFSDTKYGDLAGQTYNGDIDVSSTKITSLTGAPKSVSGNFYCSGNNLTSLKGAPTTVGGDFTCYNNPKLTSLKGAPKNVENNFTCSNNPKLTSLDGAPESIGGNFYGSSNPKLTQNEIYKLLDTDIKDKMVVPYDLTAPTPDDYKLYNRLHKDMKKFLKIKELKAKLK